MFNACITRSPDRRQLRSITLGHPLLDEYLTFVGARVRANTWLATAYDLKDPTVDVAVHVGMAEVDLDRHLVADGDHITVQVVTDG